MWSLVALNTAKLTISITNKTKVCYSSQGNVGISEQGKAQWFGQERMMTSSLFRRNNDDVIMHSCLVESSLLLTGVVTGCCQQLNAPRKYPVSCLSGDGCFCITVHICIHLHDFITTQFAFEWCPVLPQPVPRHP